MNVSVVIVAVALGLVGGILAQTDGEVRRIGKYDWAAVTRLDADLVFNCTLMTVDDNDMALIVGQDVNTTVDLTTAKWHMPEGTTNQTGNKRIDGEGRLHIYNITTSDKGVYLCSVKTDCTIQECNSTLLWFKHGLNLNGPIYVDLMDKYRMNLIIGSASAGGVLGFFLLSCLIYKFRYKEDKMEQGDVDLYTGTKVGETDTSAHGSDTKDEMSSNM